MSELKWNWVYYPYLDAPNKQEESALKAGYIKVVIKDEADKVIAEKDEAIEEMEERIADGDKDFEMANNQNERLLKIVRHHKYKRCLAMAKMCGIMSAFEDGEWYAKWINKWYKRWQELAKKFKPNSTAQ